MIRLFPILAPLFLSALLMGCQQPASAPKTQAAKVEAPAPAEEPEPMGDDGAMPANWQEADGPGASTIFIEDDGQRFALECSRKDSPAASAPGKVTASVAWRTSENPPKAPDVALILDGAGFRAPPIWARDNGRDAVMIQLDPTADLLTSLGQANASMRIIAGDWFIAIAPDSKGIVARFAKVCGQYTKAS
jgi:hypothetical protein